MARVVLVQPPHRDTFGYSMPPLGALHLGAAARERGHEPIFVDLALAVRAGELPAHEGLDLIEASVDLLLSHRPDAIGIGAMISSMPAALHLAARLAARAPELPVILGGQGPETVEEAVLARHPALAAVAVGESDATFREWLDALEQPDEWWRVAGLVVRRDGRPFRTAARPLADPLDTVPGPAWDLAQPPASYAAAAGQTEAMFPIDLGRGCTFACSFCTTPIFWGRAARHLSATRAVDELDRLAALDALDCAYVTHDLFTFDRTRVLDICAEKLRRGNDLAWECRTRADLVDPELLKAMAAAGCRRILYGVESDSPDVLARVNKGGRPIDAREVVAMTAAAGIASIVGVMVGVPGEIDEDIEANLDLMAELGAIDGTSLSLHWFNVTPGNDRAAEIEARGESLRLVPGVTADLVRGYDLPAGHVSAAQWALIRDDPEIFASFRVAATSDAAAHDMYRLTRNAHLVLEALPRTAALLARRTGTGLREHLAALFAWLDDDAAAWEEPGVLRRRWAVTGFAALARRAGHADVTAITDYEEALFATTTTRLVRFELDPVDVLAALADGRWPESDLDAAPGAVLFIRRGDRVATHSLSPFLADVAEGVSERDLNARWPGADSELLDQARQQLAALIP